MAPLKEAILLSIQFPLGTVVAIATERFCRRGHVYARWRNIGIKSLVAYTLVVLAMGDSLGRNALSISAFLVLLLRFLLLVIGILIGTALQPVGLTGGIATGKSTVSSLLSTPHSSQNENVDELDDNETDFIVIDVDGIAHDILLPEKLSSDSVYCQLVAEFGREILEDNKDSKKFPFIDRRKLGDIVFRDRQKRRKLNSITHPKIIKIMLKRLLVEGLNVNSFFKTAPKRRRVVCADIPLLFEGGLPMRMLFGTIIVVTCKPELQLERLRKRNSDLSLEQCRERIGSQMPVEEKARRAHMIIRNDGNMKDLKSQVLRLKKEVASSVAGKQRGMELWWLVLGFIGLRLLW